MLWFWWVVSESVFDARLIFRLRASEALLIRLLFIVLPEAVISDFDELQSRYDELSLLVLHHAIRSKLLFLLLLSALREIQFEADRVLLGALLRLDARGVCLVQCFSRCLLAQLLVYLTDFLVEICGALVQEFRLVRGGRMTVRLKVVDVVFEAHRRRVDVIHIVLFIYRLVIHFLFRIVVFIIITLFLLFFLLNFDDFAFEFFFFVKYSIISLLNIF